MFMFYCFRLAVTKLDILDGFDEVKIGTHYMKNGQRIEYYPGLWLLQFKCILYCDFNKASTSSHSLNVEVKIQANLMFGTNSD